MTNSTLVSSAAALLLAFGAAAHAEVPKELAGTWDPCRYDFGTHTHSTVVAWASSTARIDDTQRETKP
jgi:hypothetical protein